jgi:hypothetical protein
MIGFGIFVCMGGLYILPPDRIDWIMAGFLDPQQCYLGWEFFRHTPLWQFPIGANPALGMDIASSIVFTDSIPLLAVIFKPFSPLLSDTFQYFGFWLMLCFVLQYFFAHKLISYFTADSYIQMIGACFFVLAPVFLSRTGIHLALSGHWLVLAAFCLFFAQSFFAEKWLILLCLGVSINVYLFLMVALIWCCDIAQRFMKKEIKLRHALTNLGQGVILGVFLMWVLGYFMLGPAPKAGMLPGMNVLALFNPGVNVLALFNQAREPDWSKIIPGTNMIGGDGFMFLGMGNILLLISALILWFRSPTLIISNATKYALCILTASLSIIALSNTITIGEYKIFSYPLFKPFEYFYTVFRSYARMFWPIYYLIILFSLVVISKTSRRASIVMITLFLAVNIYDSAEALASIRTSYANPPKWESPLKAKLWNDFARRYDKVLYVLPYNNFTEFVPWVDYAARHSLPINMGYFARADENKIKTAQLKLTKELVAGDFDASALYVFEDKKLWDVAILKLKDDDLAGELDGFHVLAPGLKTCKDCSVDSLNVFPVQQDRYFEIPDGFLSFRRGDAGDRYLLHGWAWPEPWGTWSDGHEAVIHLKLKKAPTEKLALHISGLAAVLKEKHPLQRIDVIINNYKLWTIERNSLEEKTHVIFIPKYIYHKTNGKIEIILRFPDAVSPADLGLNEDRRMLSFGLTKLWMSQ